MILFNEHDAIAITSQYQARTCPTLCLHFSPPFLLFVYLGRFDRCGVRLSCDWKVNETVCGMDFIRSAKMIDSSTCCVVLPLQQRAKSVLQKGTIVTGNTIVATESDKPISSLSLWTLCYLLTILCILLAHVTCFSTREGT